MKDYKRKETSRLIKKWAAELGFIDCGISKAMFLDSEATNLENWIKANRNAQMEYMALNFDKRLDPRKLLEGCKSVVSVLLNYFPQKKQCDSSFKISKYAYGQDYHFLMKKKLRQLLEKIQNAFGAVNGRALVDSAPILDKVWAERSGLGWRGKHTLLLKKNRGSFFFIGELLLDMELAYDAPTDDHCGNCTRCIDACPTEALEAPYTVDANKCISYLTIELKNSVIPKTFEKKFEDWIFGCDICQDVCPWNRFSVPHQEKELESHPDTLQMSKSEWEALSEISFQKLFKKSAVKRAKYAGLKRNINFVAKKN